MHSSPACILSEQVLTSVISDDSFFYSRAAVIYELHEKLKMHKPAD